VAGQSPAAAQASRECCRICKWPGRAGGPIHFRAAAERIGYIFIGSEPELERLQRQIAAARRALVDIDHAAARLSAGRFGFCEQCGADIPVARLATIPEARYCPGCSAGTP